MSNFVLLVVEGAASVEDLVAAVRALLPTQWPRFEGEVDGDPSPPWIVSNVSTPDGAHRSEAAHVAGGDLDVYVTIAGDTEASARIVLTAVADALSGASVTASGWSTGRLVEYQRPRVYPTDVEVSGEARHMFAGVVGYRTTVSRLRES